jgi:hypothetical protein
MQYLFTTICFFFLLFSCAKNTPDPIITTNCTCEKTPATQGWGFKYGILYRPTNPKYPYTLIDDEDFNEIRVLSPICMDSTFLSQIAINNIVGDTVLVECNCGIVGSIECEFEGIDRSHIIKGRPLRVYSIKNR